MNGTRVAEKTDWDRVGGTGGPKPHEHCSWEGGPPVLQGIYSRRSDPGLRKLALGTWNVTSLMGKEPELVSEIEKLRLHIVGLTSTHGRGSGTSLLEGGWTLYHSGIAESERWRAGVAILVAPPAWCLYIGVYPGE